MIRKFVRALTYLALGFLIPVGSVLEVEAQRRGGSRGGGGRSARSSSSVNRGGSARSGSTHRSASPSRSSSNRNTRPANQPSAGRGSPGRTTGRAGGRRTSTRRHLDSPSRAAPPEPAGSPLPPLADGALAPPSLPGTTAVGTAASGWAGSSFGQPRGLPSPIRPPRPPTSSMARPTCTTTRGTGRSCTKAKRATCSPRLRLATRPTPCRKEGRRSRSRARPTPTPIGASGSPPVAAMWWSTRRWALR